jgi:4'-phosphopantetheinyl transferase EntD
VLEQILPSSVAVVATRSDSDAQLFPEEEWIIRRAIESRRREFVTARACAREALTNLGLPLQSIPADPQGIPVWPEGIVGSITHCAGYRAAAVGRTQDLAALAIDAEPNRQLRHRVLSVIASPSEIRWVRQCLRESPHICWDRLLFCIKEAVYKVWFLLTGKRLGFQDVKIEIDQASQEFSASLEAFGSTIDGATQLIVPGRWLVADGLIATAIALSQPAL